MGSERPPLLRGTENGPGEYVAGLLGCKLLGDIFLLVTLDNAMRFIHIVKVCDRGVHSFILGNLAARSARCLLGGDVMTADGLSSDQEPPSRADCHRDGRLASADSIHLRSI